ncbi:uncharacterized protein LOC103966278 [Pyrus x bretschneideri]|uniref:uncharacterized protein LOC103966278 n=1 Tax=Pyrus x bretschneideri TaxID=225117 RepID=UPI000510DBDF|nr:uncharacterized protein LOC103966278 [Pyrus x bretschneideri]XP_048431843.1 uncharacterized protein LOC103966278 [Pyrus x bretschneideri]
MDLTPFKRDVDELIDEFTKAESTSLADMKRIWLSKKFSYIYEARPSTNLAFFMQSLYAHSIGYIVDTASLSHRVGGLYCLFCLYETQPCKPPFKIYISLEELKKLRKLVIDAKENNIKVVSSLVRKMLEKNTFLFGFVDTNEESFAETVNQLTQLQNARVQVAYKELFANTKIEDFLHMDLGMEVDLNTLKKMSTEYAEAKKIAITEASKVVDVGDIKHIAEGKELVGDVAEKMVGQWDSQREVFYRQTGANQRQLQLMSDDDNDDFDKELEQLLSGADYTSS